MVESLALAAPALKPLETPKTETGCGTSDKQGRPCYRDVAILETIYSCGLRISELLRFECGGHPDPGTSG